MSDAPHLVFSGGGTGGHLFPGLAVAEAIGQLVPRASITFAGTGSEFERRHVASAGYHYLAIPCRPRPGHTTGWIRFVADNLAGLRAASRFLARERPSAVIGLGGYASFPMARAASLHGIPLVLLEQNAVAGKATRSLARHASLICTAFASAANGLRHRCPLVLTGNPVRGAFIKALQESQGNPNSRVRNKPLLVLGGSQGSDELNRTVPAAIARADAVLRDWLIVHQSGERHLSATRERYRAHAIDARVVPFLDNLPEALAQTDLVISRAGATTLSEIALLGVPAILVPYHYATDQHQLRNAEHFAAAGGACLIDSTTPQFAETLASSLSELAASDGVRAKMSAAMQTLARPNAAQRVAGLIWNHIESRATSSAQGSNRHFAPCFFLASRKGGNSAKVKSTTSSPVTVLMSW